MGEAVLINLCSSTSAPHGAHSLISARTRSDRWWRFMVVDTPSLSPSGAPPVLPDVQAEEMLSAEGVWDAKPAAVDRD